MPKPPKDLTFSIAKLELEAGDILVVKGTATYNNAHAALSNLVPGGVRILYVPPDVELSVMTKADLEVRLAGATDLVSARIEEGRRTVQDAYADRTLYGKPPQ